MIGAAAPRIVRLGPRPYGEVYDAMRAFTGARHPGSPDEIWLTEHPPVYTQGQAGRAAHAPRESNPIPVVKIDRGGQITYHGPGQAVMYVLLDLARRGLKIRTLVERLETSAIDVLASFGVTSERRAGAPGVYVDGAKIAALGLRVRQGRSYHGLSLNVAMDLAPFASIDPCGYPGLAVTQLRDLGVSATPADVADALAGRFVKLLEDD